MRSSTSVANQMLQHAFNERRAITPMALLKMVYICHGWMLGLYSRPLITEEVQAWKYGPVIPSLYRYIKKYRNNPITEFIKDNQNVRPLFDPIEEDIIRQVYDKYSAFSGIELSNMTHKFGTPWFQTYSGNDNRRTIPEGLIAQYYGRLAATAGSS